MRRYFNVASIYMILALVAGVFYREFTKLSGFEGDTVLRGLHTHIFIWGFIFILILVIIEKNFSFSKVKGAGKWFITYNISLIYFIVTMILRGVSQVKGFDMPGLSHIAGLSHALMGVSLVWFIILGNKMLQQVENE